VAGSVLLEGNQLPGVWMVISGWDPELIPDREGKPTTQSVCRAVALALVPANRGLVGMQLRVTPARAANETHARGSSRLAPSLEVFQRALAEAEGKPAKLAWSLNDGVVVELEISMPSQDPSQPAIGRRPLGRAWSFEQAGAGTENKR
jgi:hypothetical protein